MSASSAWSAPSSRRKRSAVLRPQTTYPLICSADSTIGLVAHVCKLCLERAQLTTQALGRAPPSDYVSAHLQCRFYYWPRCPCLQALPGARPAHDASARPCSALRLRIRSFAVPILLLASLPMSASSAWSAPSSRRKRSAVL